MECTNPGEGPAPVSAPISSAQRCTGIACAAIRYTHHAASISPETFESVSLDDHRRGFAVAMAALLAEFNAYLDRDDADPAADLVGCQQRAVWLSRDELHGMISELRNAIAPRVAN
jgi:hypothetical protein